MSSDVKPSEVRVVFLGSPAFAEPSLRALASQGYQILGVLTKPDRPAGRGGRPRPPEVKTAALELGLQVFQPERLRDEKLQDRLRALEPDVFVVAAYGKILPQAVLDIPAKGSLNVHASLLPRWRGASPIDSAILVGDTETGVTIMEVVMQMDAGPIVAQARTRILPDDTTGTLEPRLAELGANLLIQALPRWLDGTLVPEPQDEALVTMCSLIRKEDGHLRASLTAAEAERAVRAYSPWPGAYVIYRGERLGIWRASVRDGSVSPGTIVVVDRRPAIGFSQGLLVLHEVQRPGSKRLRGEDFLNGERGHLDATAALA